MAGLLQENLNKQDDAVLTVFESIVVEQTKSFLLFVGKEFPDLNKLAQKIQDIPSIRKNISLIALITYTLIYNKRPQGLELSDQGNVDEVANLKILIESVAAGVSTNLDEGAPVIDAEAILLSTSRANTALNIHAFVKLLEQLHRETLPEDVHGQETVVQMGEEEEEEEGNYLVQNVEDPVVKDMYIKDSMNRRTQKPEGRGRGRTSSEGNIYSTTVPSSAARKRIKDPVDELEVKALHELISDKKQQAARIRRMKGLHKKKQQARSANLLRNERRGEHKRASMAAELERLELSKRVLSEADNKRAVESLLKQVLYEMSKEAKEEDLMNAEHLRVLEQQRISQTAASRCLFVDRANLIREKAIQAAESRSHTIREQEKYLETVFRESEARHQTAIEAKLDQLNLLEDAAILRAKESRHAVADLFNSTRLQYLSTERAPKSPFDKTLREIRSNAHQLRQQQVKMRKQKQLRSAYASKPFASTARVK